MPWNKGLTKETDPMVARQGCYVRSEKQKEVSTATLTKYVNYPGHVPWNKGLTKADHPGIAIAAEKARQYNLGRHHSAETREKMRGKRGKYCESGRRKEVQDRYWASISPELKSEFIRRSRAKTSKKKTNPEAILESMLDSNFPNEWKYVGDGKLIINGLIPDFANVNGKKQLIEVFGDYWHRDENPQSKIDEYSRFGYDCIVVWERELKDNLTEVLHRIENLGRKEEHQWQRSELEKSGAL